MNGRASTLRRAEGNRGRLSGFWVWPLSAGVMMAHHVAGKAARDGFFLSNFGADALPWMIAGGAGFAVLAGWISGMLMSRHTPRTVAPFAFLLSAALQAGEWRLLDRRPAEASVLIFLHMGGLGAVLLSAFWSILNEEFDPREAKSRFGLIAAGGTAGGVAGAFAAERVTAWFGAPSLLPALAALHLAAGALLAVFAPQGAREKTAAERHEGGAFRLLARSEYLLKLTALVVLAATGAALLDYIFKTQAAATWGRGPNLIRFLALYHGGVSLLTLCAQWFGTRRSLEAFGLGKTIASQPAVLAAGSFFAFAVPAFFATVIARVMETAVRNSLFRTGYEVCFTPVPALEKRRLKSAIDVGAERTGDALGGGIALLCLWLAAADSRNAILLAATAVGGGAFTLAKLLEPAYVRALAESLTRNKIVVEPETITDLTTRSVLTLSGFPEGAAPPARIPRTDLSGAAFNN